MSTNNHNPEITNCNCPGCQQELEYYKQQLHPKSARTPSWIGTCRTEKCDFQDVTLSDANWTRVINESDFANQYRGLNARLLAQMGKG